MCRFTDCKRFNVLQGGHSKASTTIRALPFSFNIRDAKLQQWHALDHIKALCDDEGNIKVKNAIKNPYNAYDNSLLQFDLIIRSGKARLISQQDYTSNNVASNHRHHQSMNLSTSLCSQNGIQSNDSTIGLLSAFNNRVISLDVINTMLRTRVVSCFWFSLQPNDPNHWSQEVPKPYLRIRYSLDKRKHFDLFVYVN